MLSYIVFWALFLSDSTILDGFLSVSAIAISICVVRFMFSRKVVFDS